MVDRKEVLRMSNGCRGKDINHSRIHRWKKVKHMFKIRTTYSAFRLKFEFKLPQTCKTSLVVNKGCCPMAQQQTATFNKTRDAKSFWEA